jgi:hypothetical protein
VISPPTIHCPDSILVDVVVAERIASTVMRVQSQRDEIALSPATISRIAPLSPDEPFTMMSSILPWKPLKSD